MSATRPYLAWWMIPADQQPRCACGASGRDLKIKGTENHGGTNLKTQRRKCVRCGRTVASAVPRELSNQLED